MYGAILGDMIGAPYEFDRGDKTKNFPLFSRESQFTDDSVMTVAVTEALLELNKEASEDDVHREVISSMRAWGRKYPYAGYGARFISWLFEQDEPRPYGSYGNGSAMRVSAAGWLYDTIEETRRYARMTAEVTHDHPEGIKGAEATAAAIYMARKGASKNEIKEYVIKEFDYDLSRTCDEIRPGYHHVESCQKTVPEAITAFLEGADFEDVIRTAVSLGGDCDTLTCIAGSIAEAFYGVPEELKSECRERLSEDMLEVLGRFEERMAEIHEMLFHDSFIKGNELIEEAINKFHEEESKENVMAVLEAIRHRMHADGHFIFPVITDENDERKIVFRTVRTANGKCWNAALTSNEEYEKGEPSQVISNFIDSSLRSCLEQQADGFILNPWSKSFVLTKELIKSIFKADGDVEYTVPDDPVTPELLEDGKFLKRAIGICNRNRTELNLVKLARILRESWIYIPCNMVLSDEDHDSWNKIIAEAAEKGDLDSLIGQTFTSQDNIRFVPDILQNGEDYFVPVFTSEEEMGEYGKRFSVIEEHFLSAINLARNNKKDVAGIVINAFTEPFIVPKEIFDAIEAMPSGAEDADDMADDIVREHVTG